MFAAQRTPSCRRATRGSGRRQGGAALLFALMALAVMMVATLALLRAVDTSQRAAGSLADRRDQMNQTDLAVAAALARFTGGGALVADAARQANLQAANYSATMLAVNANGIPLALLANDAGFNAAFSSANDIAGPAGTLLRYVIDRLCVAGTAAPSTDNCMVYQPSADKGGSHRVAKAGTTVQWVYRISVRVRDTRRNTLTFAQTTVGA